MRIPPDHVIEKSGMMSPDIPHLLLGWRTLMQQEQERPVAAQWQGTGELRYGDDRVACRIAVAPGIIFVEADRGQLRFIRCRRFSFFRRLLWVFWHSHLPCETNYVLAESISVIRIAWGWPLEDDYVLTLDEPAADRILELWSSQ